MSDIPDHNWVVQIDLGPVQWEEADLWLERISDAVFEHDPGFSGLVSASSDGDWLPMETAPRDGTPIIALYDTNDGSHLPVVVWWSEHDKEYPWHYGTQDACREDRIAYWKPLPPMPAVVWEEHL